MSSKLDQLGLEVQELQDRQLESRERAPLDVRLVNVQRALDRAALVPSRSRSVLRDIRSGAPWFVAAALAAACITLFFTRPSPSLTAERTGRAVQMGDSVESTLETIPVSFSDGTILTLAHASRARVVRIDANGAELALERGTLTASVVKRPNARWVVSAGPFQILVTGTLFDATWNPTTEVLDVVMQEGSVRVSGSCVERPTSLSAGESLAFSCRKVVSETKSAMPPAPTTDAPSHADPSPKASSAKVVENAGEPDWYALFGEGRFKEAFARAETKGFSSLCASESSERVLGLGNTARLAGNPARANEAFLAARQRFAGSTAAASAGFHLGRIAFDGSHDYGSARRWFTAYLTEQPGGRFAEEALGRLMEAEHRAGDRAAAEQSAARYLARFPGGAHAALAQSLTQK